eukprot:m.7972 g.7972  ORF g.7972 m.7972 type:complete len:123 (+) comp6376_c0_seq1:170-538(+)
MVLASNMRPPTAIWNMSAPQIDTIAMSMSPINLCFRRSPHVYLTVKLKRGGTLHQKALGWLVCYCECVAVVVRGVYWRDNGDAFRASVAGDQTTFDRSNNARARSSPTRFGQARAPFPRVDL